MSTTTTETVNVESNLPLSFTSVPILDLLLAESPATKPAFLAQLREALVVVGFFYLKNTSIPKHVQNEFVQKSMDLCNLPVEKKLEIDMIHSKHFLGYSRMGLEKTAQKTDCREMFDFLSPLPAPGPDDPIYMNVQGPSQWPDEKAVPGFRAAVETYLEEVGKLGNRMKRLVSETLDIEPKALDKFFNDPPRNKVSVLRYPCPDTLSSSCGVKTPTTPVNGESSVFQGVGSHKDGGFLTYLLQATPHGGLEAQNKSGTWIPVPPIPDTLTVNVGRSLESLTGGVCTATTHRVNLRPEYFVDRSQRPLGPRFSFPVFQTLKLDLTSEELTSLRLTPRISDLVKDEKVKSDAEAFFAKYHLEGPGKGIFTARLTSHPDVGRKWYPEELAQALKGQREFKA